MTISDVFVLIPTGLVFFLSSILLYGSIRGGKDLGFGLRVFLFVFSISAMSFMSHLANVALDLPEKREHCATLSAELVNDKCMIEVTE